MLTVATVLADLSEGLWRAFVGLNRRQVTLRARVKVRLRGQLHGSLVLLEVLHCRHFNQVSALKILSFLF